MLADLVKVDESQPMRFSALQNLPKTKALPVLQATLVDLALHPSK